MATVKVGSAPLRQTIVATMFAAYPKDFLTTKDVATVLRTSTDAVYKRKQRLSIPVATVAGRLVFLRSALRQWAATKPELDRGL